MIIDWLIDTSTCVKICITWKLSQLLLCSGFSYSSWYFRTQATYTLA